MKRRYSKKSKLEKDLAMEHIDALFKQAKIMFPRDKKLANRHMMMARRIAMKFKLKMPKEYKRRFCKHCHSYLVDGVNCRIRTARGKVVYYCLECRKFMRFPY